MHYVTYAFKQNLPNKKTPEILDMETTCHEVHMYTVHMVIWALKLKIYPFNNQLKSVFLLANQKYIVMIIMTN